MQDEFAIDQPCDCREKTHLQVRRLYWAEREKEKLGVLIRIELDTFFRPRESEHRLGQTFGTPGGNGDPFSQINRTPRGTLHQRAEHWLRGNQQLLAWNRAYECINPLGHERRVQI